MIVRASRLFAPSHREDAADSKMPPSWSRGSDPGAWHLGIPVASVCLLLVTLLAVLMPHQPVLVGAGGLVVLIAVLCIVAITVVGKKINNGFQSVNSSLP